MVSERHYCTYFDQGFLIQGVALWHSLKWHDAGAVLWVLALDEVTERTLKLLRDARLLLKITSQQLFLQVRRNSTAGNTN